MLFRDKSKGKRMIQNAHPHTTILNACDFFLTPCKIAFKDCSQSKNKDLLYKIGEIVKRIFFGAMAIVILPLTLSAAVVKWILSPSKSNKQEQPKPTPEPLKPTIQEIKPADQLPKRIRKFQNFNEELKSDLKVSLEADIKLGKPHEDDWRAQNISKGEELQTLDDLQKTLKNYEISYTKSLEVYKWGRFSETDNKILAITCDYLTQVHQVKVNLNEAEVSLTEARRKYEEHCKETKNEGRLSDLQENFPRQWNGKDQYYAGLIIDMIDFEYRSKNPVKGPRKHHVAFTDEDIFSDGVNYTFGVALQYFGTGVFSKARFGDPEKSAADFQKVMFSMMKIAAHEFGHMRGFHHCTDYVCNMGGYFYLPELEARTLLFCSEDSAKVCSLSEIKMTEYYQNLLKYFENFNSKYGTSCDFSIEIKSLKDRLVKLES